MQLRRPPPCTPLRRLLCRVHQLWEVEALVVAPRSYLMAWATLPRREAQVRVAARPASRATWIRPNELPGPREPPGLSLEDLLLVCPAAVHPQGCLEATERRIIVTKMLLAALRRVSRSVEVRLGCSERKRKGKKYSEPYSCCALVAKGDVWRALRHT